MTQIINSQAREKDVSNKAKQSIDSIVLRFEQTGPSPRRHSLLGVASSDRRRITEKLVHHCQSYGSHRE